MIYQLFFFIFIVCAAIQVCIVLFVFSRIIFHKQILPLKNLDPVSVIVCARNEEENIKTLIPALTSQKYPHFEIIVVNDRSSDSTYDYLLEQEKKISNLKLVNVTSVPDKMDPKKYAITLGIKAATFENLLFTDADCVPLSDDWILHIQSKLNEKTCFVLGVSRYKSAPSLLNHFIRYETLYTAINYISLALSGMPYMGVGRNLAYRKSVFLKNKGFHHIMDVTGGDDDLFVNTMANHRNTAVVTHYSGQTLSNPKKSYAEWIAQKTRHLAVSRFYTLKSKIVLALINLSHAGFYVGSAVLMFSSPFSQIALVGLFLRILLLTIVFAFIIAKLRYNFKWYLVPLFDLLYIIYLSLVGTKALRIKEVKWK